MKDAQNDSQKVAVENQNSFTDPTAVANYAQNPPRVVPGFADLQRMAVILLAENAPDNAQILVLGAGGGLELKVFAEAHPTWQFYSVDPSTEMLALAKATLGPLASRVKFHKGYIETMPKELFDAASCLLTLHFLTREERLNTLLEVRRRLKPGAPFVMAHLSFPQNEPEQKLWLSRYTAFATSNGINPEAAQKASIAISTRLPLLSPEEDEKLFLDAGFSDVQLFYTGFCFRGWVACC